MMMMMMMKSNTLRFWVNRRRLSISWILTSTKEHSHREITTADMTPILTLGPASSMSSVKSPKPSMSHPPFQVFTCHEFRCAETPAVRNRNYCAPWHPLGISNAVLPAWLVCGFWFSPSANGDVFGSLVTSMGGDLDIEGFLPQILKNWPMGLWGAWCCFPQRSSCDQSIGYGLRPDIIEVNPTKNDQRFRMFPDQSQSVCCFSQSDQSARSGELAWVGAENPPFKAGLPIKTGDV